jgi:hypothetical protein
LEPGHHRTRIAQVCHPRVGGKTKKWLDGILVDRQFQSFFFLLGWANFHQRSKSSEHDREISAISMQFIRSRSQTQHVVFTYFNSTLMPKIEGLPPYPVNCVNHFAFKFSRSKNTEITQAVQKKTYLHKK